VTWPDRIFHFHYACFHFVGLRNLQEYAGGWYKNPIYYIGRLCMHGPIPIPYIARFSPSRLKLLLATCVLNSALTLDYSSMASIHTRVVKVDYHYLVLLYYIYYHIRNVWEKMDSDRRRRCPTARWIDNDLSPSEMHDQQFH